MSRPTRETFSAPPQPWNPAPFVEELPTALEPVEAFRRLAQRPHVVFFDSALRDPQLGRYSFVAVDPFAIVELPHDAPVVARAASQVDDGFTRLQAALAPWRAARHAELPPFQGGAAGLFGYELGRRLERLPTAQYDEFAAPPLLVGLYDVVLAFDHAADRAWIISQGFPAADENQRRTRAERRGRALLQWLQTPPTSATPTQPSAPLAAAQLAPQFATGRLPGLTSNFSADGYLRAIDRVVEYIHAGDIFQANLSQRLLLPAADDSPALYLRLRERNAATFAGYFDLGEFQIISASPERFVRVWDRQVESRPIKGTRSRTSRPEADLFAQDELKASEKDRAENVMIVDLLRNDLSKVCTPESVRVSQLCDVEAYRYVQHLVSAVVGELRADASPLDLLRGAFPGGSITGAPKIRAMEIIAELEPTARGPYCGSLGYLGFDGALDTNILIRTVTAGHGWWQAPVGGGIVAQSVAAHELQETWHKAEGLLRAFRP